MITLRNLVGQQYHDIGWNEAKRLGDTYLSGSTLTLEAFGCDWAVFRTASGKSAAITTDNFEELTAFFNDLLGE